LALVTDAFGGHGGIAKFNQSFLRAACSKPECAAVVALPRLLPSPPGPLPDKLTYLADAADGKVRYVAKVLRVLLKAGPFDLVVCGHVNLVPVAWLARAFTAGRLVLIVHGIEAWRPTRNPVTNFLVKRIDAFVSVSELTSSRFAAWTGIDSQRGFLLPNSIDLETLAPGPKSVSLLQQYGLRDKVIIMTMGRLASTERYKGIDEVLEVLPDLVAEIPNLAYMIAGEGDDRARLQAKAVQLGLADRVVFTGLVPEAMKGDYFNLADAFVMPSRGEGFGIVFLEAMACGVPVVGSAIDGSAEALRNGMLGELADPADANSIKRAIRSALKQPKTVPAGLEHFSYANFERRVHQLLDRW
jgi:glycosyltransferase involved in cell wall biosynthesis